MQLLNTSSISTLANLAVATGTLFLAWMAYRQIKENRLIENVRIHSNMLKELLREWKEKRLPYIGSAESLDRCCEPIFIIDEPPSFSQSIPSDLLFTVENIILFKDVKNHLPEEHKILFDKWNDFKELIIDYDNKRYNLFKKMSDDVQKTSSTQFTIDSVYIKTISLIKEEESLPVIYDYYYESPQVAGLGDYKFWYGTRKYQIFSKFVNKDEIEKIKTNHKIISEEYSKKYEKDIKEIISIEYNLKKIRSELNKIIDDLTLYPLIPNKNCKYIKNAFK